MEKITHLLEQATALMMKYGIKSVSMDDLARQLGMSKKTIYQFVENKRDLVNKMVNHAIEDERRQVEAILSNSSDALTEMLTIARFVLAQLRELGPSLVFDMKKYYPREWDIMENHHLHYITQTITNNISRGISEGLYRSEIDPVTIAQLYHAMTHAIVDEELFPLKRFSKTDLYTHMIRYHLHGIVTDKGRAILKELDI
jgi:AcrR family transcriptional regulator